jgi:hypothetical protein
LALLTRLDPALDPNPVSIAVYAIKSALFPNQPVYSPSAASLNPGPVNPNPMSNAPAPSAQPLLPPQPPQSPPAQQAPPDGPQASPLFSVPHPVSDVARWQQMVQGPFLANSPPDPNSKQAAEVRSGQDQCRQPPRLAMRTGRWRWFQKLAGTIRVKRSMPATLVKLAQGGPMVFQHGWSLPLSFVNNPWRGGGPGYPRPMSTSKAAKAPLLAELGTIGSHSAQC